MSLHKTLLEIRVGFVSKYILENEIEMIRNCNEAPFGKWQRSNRLQRQAKSAQQTLTAGGGKRRRRRREEGPPACLPVCSVPSQQRPSDPLSLCLPKWAPARHWRRGESPSALRV